MDKITTVGLDLAKQVMSLHAVGADSRTLTRKTLCRDQLLPRLAALPPCVVGDGGLAGRNTGPAS